MHAGRCAYKPHCCYYYYTVFVSGCLHPNLRYFENIFRTFQLQTYTSCFELPKLIVQMMLLRHCNTCFISVVVVVVVPAWRDMTGRVPVIINKNIKEPQGAPWSPKEHQKRALRSRFLIVF